MKTEDKIKGIEQATDIVRTWKSNDEVVVFTNGCFDVLHLGHVDYLEKSSKLGNRLVVGVNSDKSVKKLKGKGRPVNDILSRTRILASIGFVDLVVEFDEDTPYSLISKLLPDVLVKGNDYLAENIVGAEIVQNHGGKVATIPLMEGYSTSRIIDKIRSK